MTKEVHFNALIFWFPGVRLKCLLGAIVLGQWSYPCEVMQCKIWILYKMLMHLMHLKMLFGLFDVNLWNLVSFNWWISHNMFSNAILHLPSYLYRRLFWNKGDTCNRISLTNFVRSPFEKIQFQNRIQILD